VDSGGRIPMRLSILVHGSCTTIENASSGALPIEPSPHFLSASSLYPDVYRTYTIDSSAKDQLMGTSVAIKKIMKPFSTPVLSKRTYRELKLLKHIQHENIIALSDVFISPLEDIYFVTELLGTDLHRLLTSRPLEKQFIQYFLYQILVRLDHIKYIPHQFNFYL
jgi:serine/threonine protein kinase